MSPAEDATSPRYVEGDLVRILDCPAAREEGLVSVAAEVSGCTPPAGHDDLWGYAVRPATWRKLICFDEPQLAPAGGRAPEHPAAQRIVSVRPDGTVTGFSGR